MERLCDEVIQLIFNELIDPSPLTLISKRFHHFSQDPYVRAYYFLTHYGPNEAIFYALGRGKILTSRVLDILFTSGAHLSRYLIQVSVHHYFFVQSHFIKSTWVRSVPLGVFIYFLKLAEERYGDIPRGKGEDDGSLFSTFLKESRTPSHLKTVTWETIREILRTYKFMPFCPKDPLMAQFPLALAIEPRLLPFAVENGFQMDSKYRDFVFRKMFEKPGSLSESLSDNIAHNVRELCKLDQTMFLSRTVAAEVCMEAKVNVGGYSALKTLDRSGHLRFELAGLVEDLIKSFLRTRSIILPATIDILHYLFKDFPSSHPTVRLVILITFFNTSENLRCSPSVIHAKLEAMNLTPLTSKDVFEILVNPFVDRYQVLLDYARWELGEKEDGRKVMATKEFQSLVRKVVSKCLEVPCKGKLLKRLCDGYPFAKNIITTTVQTNYPLGLDDLPAWDDFEGCRTFTAKLCQDYTVYIPTNDEVDAEQCITQNEDNLVGPLHTNLDVNEDKVKDMDDVSMDASTDLGIISQESLTTMIRQDEVLPVRSRRRMGYSSGLWVDSSSKLPYPPDLVTVGQWIKREFGCRSRTTATFMTHAIINGTSHVLANHSVDRSSPSHIPVTLQHFQMLARLGRAPELSMYSDIETGAEFYRDEEEYVRPDEKGKCNAVKAESASTTLSPTKNEASPSMTMRRRKRPRRSATNIGSYAVPDSDDEEPIIKKPPVVETSIQLWMKHLNEIMKQEQRKFKEKKKKAELLEPGVKTRVTKSEFFKSLSSHLRNLQKLEEDKRVAIYGPDVLLEVYTDDDDDDDYRRKTRTKRRKSLRSL